MTEELSRACLQLGELCARTDQNQTQNTWPAGNVGDSQISNCVTHGRSAGGGADRCGAMHCATTNGSGSRTFCPAAKAMWEGLQPTIDCSSKPFSTDIEPASPGGTSRSALAIGRSCISASVDGRRVEFSSVFSSCWRVNTTTNT